MNLADAFIAIANSRGDRHAIVTSGSTFTYRQLVERASQSARVLRDEGFGAGDRVGLALASPADTVTTLIALWMLDATVIIADFRSRAEERNRLTATFNIKAFLQTRTPPGDPQYVSIAASDDFFGRVKSQDASLFTPQASRHPALIMQTSGTTGTPVGIQREHDSFLLRNYLERSGGNMPVCETLVMALPLNYAAPLTKALCQFLDGGTVHLLPVLATARELADSVLALQADRMFVVPKQLRALLELSKGRTSPMLPSLKLLACGGAAVSAEDNLRAFKELSKSFHVSYASSVSGLISELAGADIENMPNSVGRPLPLNHVQIVSADGVPLPRGEAGIIRMRGPAVATKVLGDVRDNSDRIVDGWIVPGDMGLLDEDGYLVLTGRATEMIIRSGVTIFPSEIETALKDHEGIREIAVVGFPQDDVGEELAAFVVAQGDVTVEDLKAFSRSRLTPDKCPRQFHIVNALPQNSLGKVLRKELVEMVMQDKGG